MRTYARGDRGKWARPPLPWHRDAHRWRLYCRSITARIAQVRAEEGIDGRREPWQTFAAPLPSRQPVDRPIRLRLAPGPASDQPGDGRGRLLRRAS